MCGNFLNQFFMNRLHNRSSIVSAKMMIGCAKRVDAPPSSLLQGYFGSMGCLLHLMNAGEGLDPRGEGVDLRGDGGEPRGAGRAEEGSGEQGGSDTTDSSSLS